MSEDDDRSSEPEPHKDAALRPRDAATLVIVDRTSGEPRLLMGQRRPDQIFLPGKYVFPGGRVDTEDRAAPSADELPPDEISKLLLDMKGTPSAQRARALALAAVRETFEEAGLVVGKPSAGEIRESSSANWRAFHAEGFLPSLAGLRYFARAITPPGRPRRYDTRFFVADSSAIAHRTKPLDEELSTLGWFTLAEAHALDIPGITRVIVEDVAEWLSGTTTGRSAGAIPFYFHRNGTFHRSLLRPSGT